MRLCAILTIKVTAQMSPGSDISNAHVSAIYYTISPPKGADRALANQQGAARSVRGDEKPISRTVTRHYSETRDTDITPKRLSKLTPI